MVADVGPVKAEAHPALVSIVLPTYNGTQYLAEAIESCLIQTYPHLELIIVDDGSTTDIRPLLSTLDDTRVRYFRHETNTGLPTALNTGFAEVRGKYLTWTSDDNRYHADAVGRMVAYLEAHSEIGLVYAGCREIDEHGVPGHVLPPPPPECIWTTNCVRACFLYRREVRDRIGLYDTEAPLVEDYDYWLRTARWFRLGRLDAILYDLRVHPRRLTSTLSLDRKRESHLRVLEKLGDSSAAPAVPLAVQRQAHAAMHVFYGRDYFFAGQARVARRELWASIRLKLGNLGRLEVVGPLAKSMVGDRGLAWARNAKRATAALTVGQERLRVLHCCGAFAVNQGGTERQARAVCEALADRGHEVRALCLRGGAVVALRKVDVLPRIRAIEKGRLFGLTYLGSATIQLVRAAGRSDLLHAHHLFLDAAAALVAGRIRRRPVVAKMAGASPGGDLDRLRRTTGGQRLLRLLHKLDAVIAPSPTCREELLAAGFPAARVHVIANGVDTAYYCPLASDHFEVGGLDRDLPTVVFVGRLVEAKGLRELLEAWREVVHDIPDARLVLVGSGPLESELRERSGSSPLAGRVRLVGDVPDVRPYLRSARAFVLPSWAEGLSNALLEAMASGLPCVASDIGSIRDAVTDGEEALLVPVQAPRQLAAALSAVLCQPSLADRLGRASRKRAEAEFSLEREVDRLEELYRVLVTRTHGGGRRG
jgi:L-malate glycosyltransferase